MPDAFRNAGLAVGFFGTLIMGYLLFISSKYEKLSLSTPTLQ